MNTIDLSLANDRNYTVRFYKPRTEILDSERGFAPM